MNEGSSYCGFGSKIESVSEEAKITNMAVTGAGDGRNMFTENSVESNMKPRYLADRLGIMGWVEGREREGLTI